MRSHDVNAEWMGVVGAQCSYHISGHPLYFLSSSPLFSFAFRRCLFQVLMQAYKDLGLQVETSMMCADKLIIAWYHKHKDKIYAVRAR